MTYFYVALGICILKLHTATNAQFLHQKLKKIIFSLLEYSRTDTFIMITLKLLLTSFALETLNMFSNQTSHVLLDSQTFHWRPLSSTIRTFSNKNLNVLSQSKKISLESPNFHKLSFYRLYTQSQKNFRKRGLKLLIGYLIFYLRHQAVYRVTKYLNGCVSNAQKNA